MRWAKLAADLYIPHQSLINNILCSILNAKAQQFPFKLPIL